MKIIHSLLYPVYLNIILITNETLITTKHILSLHTHHETLIHVPLLLFEWNVLSFHACGGRPHSETPCHTWDNQPKSLDVAEYATTYNLYLCVEMHIVDAYNLCDPQGG